MQKILFSGLLCLLFLCCLICGNNLSAQVHVSLSLAPPYPIHIEDVVKLEGQAVLAITNQTGQPLNLKLLAQVEGNNGVKITVKPSFKPATPLPLSIGQSMVLTGAQLRNLNRNLTENDLDISGVSINQLIQTEQLPEGVYTVCVRAYDYFTGEPLSPTMTGCTAMNITWYDPPLLIQPADVSYCPPKTPQFQMFNWTPSGIPGKTRYRFELVDMTLNNLNNPNDAFQHPAVLPYYKQDNLTATALSYDLSKPLLIKGRRYAWRVTAYDPTHSISYKNGGKSEVWSFRYDNQPDNGFGGSIVLGNPNNQQYNLELFDDMPPGPCLGDEVTVPQHPDQALATNIGLHDSLKIGNFFIRNVNMQFTGSGYTGTGTIRVNFLHAPIKVKFDNIKINAARHVVGNSKVVAIMDVQNLYNAALAESVDGVIDLTSAQLEAIEDEINQPGRLVSALNGAVAKGLPLGLDNNKYNIAVVGLIFSPTEAWMNSALGTPIPESLTGDYLCFGMKKIQIHPNGFATTVKLSLAKDIEVKLSDYASVKFLKGADTWVELDCGGYKGLSVNGSMIFSRDRVLPIDGNGVVIADNSKKLTAGFLVQTADKLASFIAQVTLSNDFVLPQARNLPFKRPNNGNKTPELVLDFSETANAQGFAQAYPNKPNSWKGIFIKGLEVILPDQFKKNNQPLRLTISNLLIDKTGISVNTSLNGEILKASEGDLAGLGLNINHLGLTVESSNLTGGSIGGSVKTPISNTVIGYQCVISKGQNNQANFGITLNGIPDLTIDMWLATAEIDSVSSIFIGKVANKWSAKIDLTGAIAINFNENNKPGNAVVNKFEMPAVKFEHLVVNTVSGGLPSLEEGVLDLDNVNLPQIKIASFEVTLDDLKLSILPNNRYGLTMPMTLSLLGQNNGGQQQNNANTVSAGTTFTVIGKLSNKSFVYDAMELEEIYVNQTLGPVKIWGGLKFFNGDNIYGNGFRANINASVECVGVGGSFTTQFGKVNNMKYLYVDAMLSLPGTTPIPGTTVALYGVGGGFWYNMQPQAGGMKTVGINQYKASGNENNFGGSQSGVKYLPMANKLGFKASVAFGMAGGQQAAQTFNGDLEFGMQLDYADMSLDSVGFGGNAYVMQSFTDRSSGAVKMFAHISYVPEQKHFHGLFGVDINIAKGALKGGGEVELDFNGSTGKWFIAAGKWSPAMANTPWEDDSRINIKLDYNLGSVVNVDIAFFGYFMVGNNIPNGLPPVPQLIYDNLPALKKPASQEKAVPTEVQGGSGIALGLGVHVDIDVKVLFFYASAEMLLGADIVLLKDAIECDNNGGDYGVNGWYASGQAYAYLSGEAGLMLDVWFCKKCTIPLIELKVGAVLRADMPNPVWMKGDFAISGKVLGGLIEVNTSVSFEVGEKCTPDKGAFGDYPMIADLKPANNAFNVDHFTNPSIAFNFDRDEWYQLSELDTDSKVMMAVDNNDIKLERKSGNNWVKVDGTPFWNKDKSAVAFAPKQMLESDTDYRLSVKAKGHEIRNGDAQPVVTESKSVQFHTKKTAPDHIPWNAVSSTYPYPRQRFHTYATSSGEGWVQTFSGIDQIMNKPAPNGHFKKIVARFTEVETGQTKDVAVSYLHNNDSDNPYANLTYAIPYTWLKKQKIYRLDIVKIIKPLQAADDKAYAVEPKVKSYMEVMEHVKKQKKQLSGDNTSNKGAEIIMIGGIYFKTSKYSDIKEKIQAMKVKKVAQKRRFYDSPGEIGIVFCPTPLMTSDEPFDAYDLKGYKIPRPGTDPEDNTYHQESPIVSFDVVSPSPWLAQLRKTYFTQLHIPGDFNMTNVGIQEAHEPNFTDRWYTDVDPNVPAPITNMEELKFFGQEQPQPFEVMEYINSKSAEEELREGGYLTTGESLSVLPQQLTAAEINAAEAAYAAQQNQQQQQQGNIFNFAANTGHQGGIGLGLNGNLGANVGTQYLAVADYRAWLAGADWAFIRNQMIEWAMEMWTAKKAAEFTKAVNDKPKPGAPPAGQYEFNCRTQSDIFNQKFYQLK